MGRHVRGTRPITAIAGLLIATLIMGSFGGATALPAANFSSGPDRASALQNTALLNAYRQDNGLGPLAPDARLTVAATEYAKYLVRNVAMGHTADGRKPDARIAAAGYLHRCFWAENIYGAWSSAPYDGSALAENAFRAWRKSPVHNANMLRTKARDIGVGFWAAQRDGKYIYRAVQVFAAAVC